MPSVIPEHILVSRKPNCRGGVQSADRVQCVQTIGGDREVGSDLCGGSRVCFVQHSLDTDSLKRHRGSRTSDAATNDDGTSHVELILSEMDL